MNALPDLACPLCAHVFIDGEVPHSRSGYCETCDSLNADEMASTSRADGTHASHVAVAQSLNANDYAECAEIAHWHDYDSRRCDRHATEKTFLTEYAYAGAVRRVMGRS